MKVVHIITGLGLGGAEGCLARMVSKDSEHQHVVLSLMDGGFHAEKLRNCGIEVHSYGFSRGRVSPIGLYRLIRFLNKSKPAIVQTWLVHADLLGGIAAKLFTKAKIFWGLRNTILNPTQSPLSTRLAVFFCAHLSHWIPYKIVSCSSKAVADHVAAGYSSAKMCVVPNGIDVELFTPCLIKRESQRNAWGIDPSLFLFGMVARYESQKDHESLLAALEILAREKTPWQCVLVGNGLSPNNPMLANALKKRKLTSKVLPVGPTDDVPSVMNALDCHVLSSNCGEGFPNVIAEAMACGTPCVGTEVGDTREIIGSTGWVVPPSNPELLALAMKSVLDEQAHDRWNERKSACRAAICARFSLERMIENFHQVWKS